MENHHVLWVHQEISMAIVKAMLVYQRVADVNLLQTFFPQQQNALGSSAIVKVSEQTGAAPKPIPPRFPGSK